MIQANNVSSKDLSATEFAWTVLPDIATATKEQYDAILAIGDEFGQDVRAWRELPAHLRDWLAQPIEARGDRPIVEDREIAYTLDCHLAREWCDAWQHEHVIKPAAAAYDPVAERDKWVEGVRERINNIYTRRRQPHYCGEPDESGIADYAKGEIDRYTGLTRIEADNQQALAMLPRRATAAHYLQHVRDNQREIKEQIVGFAGAGELAVLVGSPKSRKSITMADLAVATATGGDWIGYPCLKSRVLLIDFENKIPTIVERLARMCELRGADPEQALADITLAPHRADNVTMDILERRLSLLIQNEFGVIVIDPLYKLWCSPGAASVENDAGVIGGFFDRLTKIASRTGSTVVAVHHTSKGGQGRKDLIDVGSGSSAMARGADVWATMRAHEDQDRIVIDVARRSAAKPTSTVLRLDNGYRWIPDPSADPALVAGRVKPREAKVKPVRRTWTAEDVAQLVKRLGADGGSVLVGDIVAAENGLKIHSANALLKDAIAKGLIVKTSKRGEAPAYRAVYQTNVAVL